MATASSDISFNRTGVDFGQMAGPNSRNGTKPNFHSHHFRRDNMAPVVLGVGAALMLITICLLIARIWSRVRWSRVRPTYRLKPDDWTVLGATVLALVQYLLIAFSVHNGLGHRAIFVSPATRSAALHFIFISQLFWYWSITLAKLSVALLLLRLKHTRRWRFFCYSIMFITVAAVIVQTCFQFFQCRPFSSFWDPRFAKTVQCFRQSTINGNIIVFSTIQIGLDIVFTVVPITFISKLTRPRREKIFICLLMGLGLFASCAAIIRTLTLRDFDTSHDMFRTWVKITLWAILELQFALIAATMPTLKVFLQRMLVRMGLWFYDETSEVKVREQLVKLGLLEKDGVLVTDESQAMRWPSAMSANEAGAGSLQGNKKKPRDSWEDTYLDSRYEEEVRSSVDIFAIPMKEKAFT